MARFWHQNPLLIGAIHIKSGTVELLSSDFSRRHLHRTQTDTLLWVSTTEGEYKTTHPAECHATRCNQCFWQQSLWDWNDFTHLVSHIPIVNMAVYCTVVLHYTLYTTHYIWYIIYYILSNIYIYIIYYIQNFHIIYYIVYTVYCILHAIYFHYILFFIYIYYISDTLCYVHLYSMYHTLHPTCCVPYRESSICYILNIV